MARSTKPELLDKIRTKMLKRLEWDIKKVSELTDGFKQKSIPQLQRIYTQARCASPPSRVLRYYDGKTVEVRLTSRVIVHDEDDIRSKAEIEKQWKDAADKMENLALALETALGVKVDYVDEEKVEFMGTKGEFISINKVCNGKPRIQVSVPIDEEGSNNYRFDIVQKPEL